ncbi:hypothetical protein V8G54_024783 [Vigna mungo]|uniref:Uncharacterized protein n=1 Tax=Vigna mungo TaxID=3915 RepID=A0AAQ3RRM3_VIGMU
MEERVIRKGGYGGISPSAARGHWRCAPPPNNCLPLSNSLLNLGLRLWWRSAGSLQFDDTSLVVRTLTEGCGFWGLACRGRCSEVVLVWRLEVEGREGEAYHSAVWGALDAEPVMVLRVDKEKDYIDLRECRIYEEDIQPCEERYNKSKLVHSIMRQIAEILNIDLEELYVHIGGHAFENPACYSWNLLLELAFHTHTSGDYDQLGDDLTGHSCNTRGGYHGRVVALDQVDQSKQLHEATSCLA